MLSEHFKRSEFTCKCWCGFDTVDYELILALENVREWAGDEVNPSSGCRCMKHDRNIKKKKNPQLKYKATSQHIKGRAADIAVKGKTPKEVYEYLDERYPNKYGIGSYEMFTHIDTRINKARW